MIWVNQFQLWFWPTADADCKRFNSDAAAQQALATTLPINTYVESAKAGQFSAVFLAGGHGTAADFPVRET